MATLARVEIASRCGMQVILIGGSTNRYKDATKTVISNVRDAVKDAQGDTLLVSFPGTSDQVEEGGLDATFSLLLPQLDGVFRESSQIAHFLTTEYFEVIERSLQFGVPVIPVTYLLYNGGRQTTVEEQTGIKAIDVTDGVDVEQIMGTIAPWLSFNDLVMLEMGSSPETSANLGPVAKEVYAITGVRPIVTGGVSSPELMAQITKHGPFPVVFGSVAEQTRSDKFEDLYMRFRQAHPSCRHA
jgi:heptaprenylglyceryl phosphate synthase